MTDFHGYDFPTHQCEKVVCVLLIKWKVITLPRHPIQPRPITSKVIHPFSPTRWLVPPPRAASAREAHANYMTIVFTSLGFTNSHQKPLIVRGKQRNLGSQQEAQPLRMPRAYTHFCRGSHCKERPHTGLLKNRLGCLFWTYFISQKQKMENSAHLP